ncbi:winged helix-turn-helix domain-containing protein [Paraglaciecola sp.]|uniref:winged helix-turn-helix domain-containing protein n=1 Tax=Paraglaciecola sp. TaxID=1920173 RepID=UPI003EF366FF
MGKYQLGDWVIDSSRGLLLDGDQTIKMEPKCMDLLMLLIRANGELVSRKTIMESLWQGRYVSDHAINNIVAMLRKYLNNGSDKSYITTQPKRGYILSEPALELSTNRKNAEAVQEKNNKNKLAKKWLLTTLAAMFVFGLIIITMIKPQPITENDTSILVSTFDVIDSDDGSVVFAKGLSEEINHQLSLNSSLNVIARSMAKAADNNELSNQSVARQLNAKYILEGSVRSEQNSFRIITRLINGSTGAQVWSEVYTANKKEMLSSQYSISTQLTKTISANLNAVDILSDSESNSSPLDLLRGFKLKTYGGVPSVLTANASEFFLNLSHQVDPTQSITNEWQIGMYSGSVFELFDYSPTTLLGRSSIVGWVNKGFHAGYLNNSDKDELFPGNVFKSGTLTLHPGNNGVEIVLRYVIQQDGDYDISGHFFAMDTIECLKCTSDGVNVSVRINGNQLNDAQDLTGFGTTTTYQVTGSDIALKQGDAVDFIVMPRSTFFDDATIVTASVSKGN